MGSRRNFFGSELVLPGRAGVKGRWGGESGSWSQTKPKYELVEVEQS